jgi:hypothetical protein
MCVVAVDAGHVAASDGAADGLTRISGVASSSVPAADAEMMAWMVALERMGALSTKIAELTIQSVRLHPPTPPSSFPHLMRHATFPLIAAIFCLF